MCYGFVICCASLSLNSQLDSCVQSSAAFEGYFKSSLFLSFQSTERLHWAESHWEDVCGISRKT